jgi:hypothetical protein
MRIQNEQETGEEMSIGLSNVSRDSFVGEDTKQRLEQLLSDEPDALEAVRRGEYAEALERLHDRTNDRAIFLLDLCVP